MPGLLSLLSCLIWLKIRKNNIALDLEINESNNKVLLLFSLFSLFFSLSVISLYLGPNYQRPLIYFVFLSIMSSLVILEIFYVGKQKFTYVILFQILIIGLSLIWSEQFMFRSVVGIDPAWHLMFTQQIVHYGHVMPGYAYSNIPLYHIEMAITSILTNSNYKWASILSAGIIQMVGIIIFMFLIARLIFNEKIALITALLLSTANMIIQYGWWATPNSIAAVYIPIILYLLLKKDNISNYIILIMLLMFALILTHPVTSLWLLLILVLGLSVSKILPTNYSDSNFLRNKIFSNKFSITITFFFGVLMFGVWIYVW